MGGVRGIRGCLQHHLNGPHVYCRLVRVLPRRLARKVALHWERTAIYGLLYARA